MKEKIYIHPRLRKDYIIAGIVIGLIFFILECIFDFESVKEMFLEFVEIFKTKE